MDKGKGIMEGDTSKETKVEIDQPLPPQEMPSWVIDLQGEVDATVFYSSQMFSGLSLKYQWNYVEPDDIEPNFRDIYCPSKVFLGPFGFKDSTKDQKDMKKNNLIYFLKKYDTKVDILYEPLRANAYQLRNAYAELDSRWEDNNLFLEMLMEDGCFVLEFLRNGRIRSDGGAPDNPVMSPIFQSESDMKQYTHDLLLFCNQLPMNLLLKLFVIVGPIQDLWENIKKSTLSYHVDEFSFFPDEDFAVFTLRKQSLHLLDFHRRMVLRCNFNPGRASRKRNTLAKFNEVISSATELKKLGITFMTTEADPFLPRHFSSTIYLPRIIINDSTTSLFSNVINFEKHNQDVVDAGLTEEIYLIGSLVKSAEDAALLIWENVIETSSNANEVFQVLRKMMERISLGSDHFFGSYNIESVTIVVRHTKMWKGWVHDLFTTYLKSPWTVLSLILGFIIFVSGLMQTIYTLKGYYYQIRHQ